MGYICGTLVAFPAVFNVDHQQLFSQCFCCLGNLISSCAGQEATSKQENLVGRRSNYILQKCIDKLTTLYYYKCSV